MNRTEKAVIGFLSGGFIGWCIGLAWYYLVEVPYAERHLDLISRESYLCAAGGALPLLATPLGAVLGAILIAGKRKEDDKTIWLIDL